MKRFAFSHMARMFGIALALCVSLTAWAAAFSGEYVTDEAGILSDAQAQTLEDQAASIAQSYDFGAYLVILEDFSEYGYDDVYSFAAALYDEWGYGFGDDRSGEMLLMSMANREYALFYRGYGETAFTEGGRDSLETAMLDRFRNDDWAGGFGQYMDWTEYLLEAAANGEPVGWEESGDYHPDDDAYDGDGYDGDAYDSGGGYAYNDGPELLDWVFTLAIPAIVAIAVCAGFAGQLKSVRQAAQAQEYAVPRSLNVREKSDRFTHVTESRVKVESDENKSRSGGGGGGGSHHHVGGGGSGRSGHF